MIEWFPSDSILSCVPCSSVKEEPLYQIVQPCHWMACNG